MRLNKKAIIVATCAACTLGLAAGCAPQQSENAGAAAPSGDGGAVPQEQKLTPEQQAVIDGAEGTTNEDIDENYYPGKEYLDNLWDRWDQVATEYAPEVRTLPNGQMVQRTPTEYEVNPDAWQIQAGSNSYNTYWLDADNRGCESCHADMNSLLKHLPYEHPVAWNDELDNKTTLQQCLFCHSYAPGYIAKQYEFGTLMHAVHYGSRTKSDFVNQYQGDCMSCHTPPRTVRAWSCGISRNTIACGESTTSRTCRAISRSIKRGRRARAACSRTTGCTPTTTTCATARA